MKITTNNVPRDLIHGWDLTEEELKEFDYIHNLGTKPQPVDNEPDALETAYRFFRYKGSTYDTQDCEPIFRDTIQDFKSWNGIFTETFFSGVVFKYAPDTDYEQVIVGRYCT